MKFLNAAAWVDPEHARVYFNNILIPIKHHIYLSYSRRMFEIWILRRSDLPFFGHHSRASINMTSDCVSVPVPLFTSTFSLLLRVAIFLHLTCHHYP